MSAPTLTSRLLPVDALRGLIVVLIALDHANHFVAQKHPPSEMWGGPLFCWFRFSYPLANLPGHERGRW